MTETARLLDELGPAPALVRPGNGRLNELHEDILQECRTPRGDGSCMLEALLQLFLATLLRSSHDNAFRSMCPVLSRAVQRIEDGPQLRWTLEDLQVAAGVSRTRLLWLFRSQLGTSPASYAMQIRLRRARQLLSETNMSVAEVAMEPDFSSSQHFATTFRKHFGMTPSHFRKLPRM